MYMKPDYELKPWQVREIETEGTAACIPCGGEGEDDAGLQCPHCAGEGFHDGRAVA